MKAFLAIFEAHDWYSETHIYIIQANTKSEALGFALTQLPNSTAGQWDIRDCNDVPHMELLHHERVEP